jgi:hypothetical protein
MYLGIITKFVIFNFLLNKAHRILINITIYQWIRNMHGQASLQLNLK